MYIELFPEKVKAITFGINEAEGEYHENGTIPPQKFSGRVAKINDQGTENIGVVPSEDVGTLPENVSTPLANVQGTNTYNTSVNRSKITTENNNIDYIQSFTSFIPSVDTIKETKRVNDRINQKDYESMISKNINYDKLIYEHCGNKKLIERILKVLVETVSSSQKYIYIAKENRPISEIRERYLSLNYEHIEHVLQSLPEDDSKVVLKDKYLMAYLFNAPDTIGSICKTQQMHSKSKICSREYDMEELEKAIYSNC